jgi:hypothetical protein
MKKALIIVLSLVTGCVYSPKDDHSTHYHSPSADNTKKQYRDEDYVQQYKQVDDDAPFYNNGLTKVVCNSGVRLNPHYTPIPHPVNRTIYFIESRY